MENEHVCIWCGLEKSKHYSKDHNHVCYCQAEREMMAQAIMSGLIGGFDTFLARQSEESEAMKGIMMPFDGKIH